MREHRPFERKIFSAVWTRFANQKLQVISIHVVAHSET